jgi:hypothetical protein
MGISYLESYTFLPNNLDKFLVDNNIEDYSFEILDSDHCPSCSKSGYITNSTHKSCPICNYFMCYYCIVLKEKK